MIISRMMKVFLVLMLGISLCLVINFTAHAATENENVTFGTEVDMLPYIGGGHYLSGVVGYDHFKFRLIAAKTTIPGFVTPKGFDDWDLDCRAIIVDYFPNENREGLWIGSGLEFWDSYIRNKNTGASGKFSQKIFTFGVGYIYNMTEHWYINPWAALHYNLSDSNVAVGSSTLNLPDIMYEASVKLGYKF